MAQLQPVQDLFGLGRLASTIRLNRQEERQRRLDQQQAELADLQRQSLQLGIQQKQAGLAGLQRQHQIRQGLADVVRGAENPDLAAFEYLKQNDPDSATAFSNRAFEKAGQILKIGGGAAASKYLKDTIGLDIPVVGEDGETTTVDVGDAFLLINKKTGKEIKRFNKGIKPLSPEEKKFSDKESFKRAKDIRGEISKASDSFNKISDSFGRIQASSKDVSAAGDLALIFNYMKMLDPGSVVRESEFATAQNAAGVPDRVRNLYNRVLSGEKLGLEQRKDFVNQAGNIYREAEGRNKTTIDSFVKIAEGFGLSRDQVVVERGRPKPPEEKETIGAPDFELQRTGTLPEGIPQGSKLIGNKDGNPVYQTPEGKKLMVTGD